MNKICIDCFIVCCIYLLIIFVYWFLGSPALPSIDLQLAAAAAAAGAGQAEGQQVVLELASGISFAPLQICK